MKALLVFCLMALVALFDSTQAADDAPAEPEIKVICPGLDRPPQPESPCGPGIDDWRPPELVVIAKEIKEEARPAGNTPFRPSGRKSKNVYEVKKALYGSYLGKTIQLKPSLGLREYWHEEPGDFVAAVVPGFYEEQSKYVACYRLPASEERAEAALCQARLDYAALSSACIFIGKQMSLNWKKEDEKYLPTWRSTVKVVRVIHGMPLKVGENMRVTERGIANITNYHRRAFLRLRIYFVSPSNRVTGPKAVYKVYTHLPIDQEPKIREALQHRNQCVVFEKEEHGRKLKFREVVFHGTNAEAIDLLDAMHDGAVSLFYRTLMHRRKSARPQVVAAIEKEMFRMEPSTKNKLAGFRRLKRLVDLLGDMEREDGGGDIEKLIEKYFSHIERGAPEPPESPPTGYWGSEYRRTDVNRSFTWLLMELGESESRKNYGERLLALRAKAVGRWKREVQVALDALKVEDWRELTAAMAPMKDVRPVRSRSGLRHKESGRIKLVRFSHDGKLLATAGSVDEIRLWNTEDWSLAAVNETDCTIAALRFSPDDRFLYVAGGGPGLEVHARFDTRTGKLDKAYRGHRKGICSMELSPDGKTMVTLGHYEDVMYFWDTESGDILRTIHLSPYNYRFFLSPDGKAILRPASKKVDSSAKRQKWLLEPFRGDGSAEVLLPNGLNPWGWDFTSGGLTYFAYRVKEDNDFLSEEHGRVVWGQWNDGVFKKLGEKDVPVPRPSRVAVSPDGKLLAIAGAGNEVWFLSLPQLMVLGKVAHPCHKQYSPIAGSLAFSPDGKLLAVGMEQPTPGLFRTDTFERLLPYDGHAGKVSAIFFTADGKRLRSYGNDNLICDWDMETMRMLRRIKLPAGYRTLSIREPDGRYAICYHSGSDKPGSGDPFSDDESQNTIIVFDAESGKIIAKLALPDGHVQWIDDHQAVVVGQRQLCRFDYRKGKVLETIKLDDKWRGLGELTEDGRSLFDLRVNRRAAVVAPTILDIATGKITSRKPENPERVRVGTSGLVPGGKYFYLADPNVYIYDRRTLKQVSKKVLERIDILSLSFLGDGRRYALVSGGRIYIEDLFKPKTQSIIRIHDTLSGKTLLAFPASSRWARVKFSPDGKRLAVVNDDDTIEVWTLPAESL